MTEEQLILLTLQKSLRDAVVCKICGKRNETKLYECGHVLCKKCCTTQKKIFTSRHSYCDICYENVSCNARVEDIMKTVQNITSVLEHHQDPVICKELTTVFGEAKKNMNKEPVDNNNDKFETAPLLADLSINLVDSYDLAMTPIPKCKYGIENRSKKEKVAKITGTGFDTSTPNPAAVSKHFYPTKQSSTEQNTMMKTMDNENTSPLKGFSSHSNANEKVEILYNIIKTENCKHSNRKQDHNFEPVKSQYSRSLKRKNVDGSYLSLKKSRYSTNEQYTNVDVLDKMGVSLTRSVSNELEKSVQEHMSLNGRKNSSFEKTNKKDYKSSSDYEENLTVGNETLVQNSGNKNETYVERIHKEPFNVSGSNIEDSSISEKNEKRKSQRPLSLKRSTTGKNLSGIMSKIPNEDTISNLKKSFNISTLEPLMVQRSKCTRNSSRQSLDSSIVKSSPLINEFEPINTDNINNVNFSAFKNRNVEDDIMATLLRKIVLDCRFGRLGNLKEDITNFVKQLFNKPDAVDVANKVYNHILRFLKKYEKPCDNDDEQEVIDRAMKDKDIMCSLIEAKLFNKIMNTESDSSSQNDSNSLIDIAQANDDDIDQNKDARILFEDENVKPIESLDQNYEMNSKINDVSIPENQSKEDNGKTLGKCKVVSVACQTTSDLHKSLLYEEFPELFSNNNSIDELKISKLHSTPLIQKLYTDLKTPVSSLCKFTKVSEPTSSERKHFNEDEFMNRSIISPNASFGDKTIVSECDLITNTPTTGRDKVSCYFSMLKSSAGSRNDTREDLQNYLDNPSQLAITVGSETKEQNDFKVNKQNDFKVNEQSDSKVNEQKLNPTQTAAEYIIDSQLDYVFDSEHNFTLLNMYNKSSPKTKTQRFDVKDGKLVEREDFCKNMEKTFKNNEIDEDDEFMKNMQFADGSFSAFCEKKSRSRMEPVSGSEDRTPKKMEDDDSRDADIVSNTPTGPVKRVIYDGTLEKLHERSKTLSLDSSNRKEGHQYTADTPKKNIKTPKPRSIISGILQDCNNASKGNGFQNTQKRKLLYPLNSDKKEERMLYLVPSGLSKSEVNVIQQLATKMGVQCSTTLSSETTHLIVKTNQNNQTQRTLKYLQALVKRICIVSFSWIQECIKRNQFVNEDMFIPLDCSGEYGPSRSFKASKGFEDRLAWLKDYCFYILPSFSGACTVPQLQDILKDTGAVVVEEMKHFEQYSNYHKIVIVNDDGNDDDFLHHLTADLFDNYQAIIIDCEWVMEVIGRYRLVPFSPFQMSSITSDTLLRHNFPPEVFLSQQTILDEA